MCKRYNDLYRQIIFNGRGVGKMNLDLAKEVTAKIEELAKDK